MKKIIALVLSIFMIVTSLPVFATSEEFVAKDIETSVVEITEDIADETSEESKIEPMSLLPLREKRAYLFLDGYTKDELSSMSVDTIVDMLKDADGYKIEIDSNATTIWRFIKDTAGDVEEYEKYTIGQKETIDIYPGDGIDQFVLEFIIGDGAQLNKNNTRYIISVYMTDQFEEDLDVEIYIQDESGKRTRVQPDNCKKSLYTYSVGAEEIIFDLSYKGSLFDSLASQGSVWLNIKSELINNPRVDIKIYPVIVLNNGYATVNTPITDKILNQDMGNTNAGYQIYGERNSDSTFEMVIYVDGEIYKKQYIGVRYWNWYPLHDGSLYKIDDDGVRENVFSNVNSTFKYKNHVSEIIFELQQGLSSEEKDCFVTIYML